MVSLYRGSFSCILLLLEWRKVFVIVSVWGLRYIEAPLYRCSIVKMQLICGALERIVFYVIHKSDEKSLTVDSETVLCNVLSMRRSVPSPDEILRRELKIRRAAEYFNCNLRCTFSVSYTTLFTELIYPQKRHFFPKTHQTCSNSVCHSSLLTWWNTVSHLSHFNTNQVHFVTAELPQFILALITF